MDKCVYYGSRFSPNMRVTPEGFLIALNVPIARTGWYEYLPDEIGAPGDSIVKVYRSPDEVFHPAAIASFQAMPVTDDHPPEPVNADNSTVYTRGVVQNVRPGNGDDADLLLADLVIHDKRLIDEVMSGKREVSAGYTCNYTDNGDGTYAQTDIRGNHVAVVDAGRAGNRVAIKDGRAKTPDQSKEAKDKMPSQIKLPRKKTNDSKSLVRDFMAAIGFKHFAVDAEPEEIMDAVEEMANEKYDGRDEEPPAQEEAKDAYPAIAALAAQVQQLTELVQSLAKPAEADPMDALEAEINRLQGGANDDDDPDSSATIEPGEFSDDNEPGPVAAPEDRPESALDNAYRLQALKAVKPIIAAIKDPVQRKQAADAAMTALKGNPSKPAYSGMTANRQKPAKDGAAPKVVDHSQLGREIAMKHNPHYKNKQ